MNSVAISMKRVESIVTIVRELGLEDIRVIEQAIHERLDELHEGRAFERAPREDDEIDSLDAALERIEEESGPMLHSTAPQRWGRSQTEV